MEPAKPPAGVPNVFQSDIDTWLYYDLYEEDDSLTIKDTTKAPVVGDKESLSAVAAECETGSSLIKENIKLLGDQYSALRRTRRDGNCFCRAFLVAYLEYIWESKDVTEVSRVKSSVNQCMTALKNGGYHPYVFENNFDVFFENLDCMTDQTSIGTGEELLINLQDEQTSDILVMSLRLAIAADILNQTDFFREFGLLDDGIEDIVEKVLTMERSVEDMHVAALCNALGVPFRVIYLDRHPSKAGSGVNEQVYLPSSIAGSASGSEEKPDEVQPLFTLLYRPPGHYDVLYS